MTLMAGPIDTRVNPTKVNELAMGKPISWFEQNLIHRVPLRYPGAMRRVYPGFVQLTAFMSMNAERHIKAQVDLYKHLAKGEHRAGRHHQGLLRRVFRRARPGGGVLPRDRAVGVPGAPAGQGRTRLEGQAGQSQGDPARPRCSPSRASATISAPSARPWPPTISVPACGPIARSTICRPASAITACSAAAAGPARSTPWCETRSWPTNSGSFLDRKSAVHCGHG